MPTPAEGATGARTTEDDEPARSRGSRSDERRRGPSDEGRGVARKLLQRFRGRAEEALAELADENKDLRIDRRELRTELATFKGDGVVVLKADDAKAYNAYKALGTPDELTTKLKELPTLQAKVTESERRTSGAEAGKLLKWNPDATASMILDKNLEVSLVDGQDKDGKAIKVPHVKPAGDKDAKAVPLADYVKEKASYLMPALTAPVAGGAAGTGGAGGNGGTTTGTGQRTGGTQFVEQGATSGTAPSANASQSSVPGRRPYMTPGQRQAASGNK